MPHNLSNRSRLTSAETRRYIDAKGKPSVRAEAAAIGHFSSSFVKTGEEKQNPTQQQQTQKKTTRLLFSAESIICI